MRDLRARRGASLADQAPEPALAEAPVQEKTVPLEECLENFWKAGEGLENLTMSLAAPPVDAACVKRLGTPDFWQNGDEFAALMSMAYRAVTQAAFAMALGEKEIAPKKRQVKS